MAQSLVLTGVVEYVENSGQYPLSDESEGGRIKVRLDSDGKKSTNELPWAFPLNPKVIQSVPQKGEGVFVILSEADNIHSQRYYIGPIISQPQYFANCEYGDVGRGPAMSLISASKPMRAEPLTSISRKKELTEGSFPKPQDVALIGRGQEDIVLKYRNSQYSKESEIDLRAGIRLEPSDDSIKYLQGNVIFNDNDPAYIQIKYSKNGLSGLKRGKGDDDDDKYEGVTKRTAKGVVNVVADKINLISHNDTNSFGKKIADKENLINPDELDDIMSKLHRAVYGDELITLLKKIVEVLATHTHPYPMKTPIVGGTPLTELIDYPYENIISENVRIS